MRWQAKPRECFRNALKLASELDGIVVHGKVAMGLREPPWIKMIDHAWVEKGDTVHDPTTGMEWNRETFYRVNRAVSESRYTVTQATRNLAKIGKHGPWTAEEVGDNVMSMIAGNPRDYPMEVKTEDVLYTIWEGGENKGWGHREGTVIIADFGLYDERGRPVTGQAHIQEQFDRVGFDGKTYKPEGKYQLTLSAGRAGKDYGSVNPSSYYGTLAEAVSAGRVGLREMGDRYHRNKRMTIRSNPEGEIMSIWTEVKVRGIPYRNHESDLYIPVTDETTSLLRKLGIKFSTFRNRVEGKLWYDIPFAYEPWWERKNIERGMGRVGRDLERRGEYRGNPFDPGVVGGSPSALDHVLALIDHFERVENQVGMAPYEMRLDEALRDWLRNYERRKYS